MATGGSSEVQKVTVSLPKSLLERLRERVPGRQRSSFIAAALEERLALEDQLEAIKESAGSWSGEDYPGLVSDEDIDRWLAELRSPWQTRIKGVEDTASEEG